MIESDTENNSELVDVTIETITESDLETESQKLSKNIQPEVKTAVIKVVQRAAKKLSLLVEDLIEEDNQVTFKGILLEEFVASLQLLDTASNFVKMELRDEIKKYFAFHTDVIEENNVEQIPESAFKKVMEIPKLDFSSPITPNEFFSKDRILRIEDIVISCFKDPNRGIYDPDYFADHLKFRSDMNMKKFYEKICQQQQQYFNNLQISLFETDHFPYEVIPEEHLHYLKTCRWIGPFHTDNGYLKIFSYSARDMVEGLSLTVRNRKYNELEVNQIYLCRDPKEYGSKKSTSGSKTHLKKSKLESVHINLACYD